MKKGGNVQDTPYLEGRPSDGSEATNSQIQNNSKLKVQTLLYFSKTIFFAEDFAGKCELYNSKVLKGIQRAKQLQC